MICGYRRIVAWGLAVVGLGSGLGHVTAAPLDPNSPLFTSRSQGDIVLSSGTYTFNLGTSIPSLQLLNGPVFTTVATGFVYNGINVFDFQSLQIQAGANISVVQSSPSGPIALLSSTTISMAGTINVSADSSFTSGPGVSNTAVGGMGGGGSIPGVQGPGSTVVTGGGGGGFAGGGQSTPSFPIYSTTGQQSGVAQGATGGSNTPITLFDQLRGGSAGGAGGDYSPTTNPAAQGKAGFGGGAIELGAIGLVSVSGNIFANGGNGQPGGSITRGAGGGGSGGGVLIHGYSVDLSGTISAVGGLGGIGSFNNGQNNSNAGNGGGGFIELVHSGTPGSYSNTGTTFVGNGRFINHAVPEPASLLLLGVVAVGGVVVSCRRQAGV